MARNEKVMIPRTIKTKSEPVEKKEALKRTNVPVVGVFKRKFKKKRADGTTYEYEGEIWYVSYQSVDAKGKPIVIKESVGKFTDGHLTSIDDAKVFRAKRITESKHDINPEVIAHKDWTFKKFVIDIYLKESKTLKMAGLKEHKQVLGEICDGLDEELEKGKREIHNPKALGKYKFSAIDAIKVGAYLTVKEDRGNADSTRNRHLAAIKKVIRIAFEKGYCPYTTIVDLKKLKTIKEENERINFLSLEQIPILLEECEKKGSHIRQIVDFALATGIRKGRIYKLKWNMIKIADKQIKIPKDKHGGAFNSSLGEGAIRILQERFEVKRPDSPYVFYNPDTGDRWYDLRGSFGEAVANANKVAVEKGIETTGLDSFVFHDCRHTFISHLVINGTPLAHVQKLAGHRTITMTIRYSHLDKKTLEAGLDNLPYK